MSPHRLFPFTEGGILRGDRYAFHQATMLDLIATAYSVDPSNALGGPIRLETDRFDVIAKVPATTSPATAKFMLQSSFYWRIDSNSYSTPEVNLCRLSCCRPERAHLS